MLKILIPTLALLMATSSKAQTNTIDSVKAAVNNMFKAMNTSDTILLKSAFNEGALLQTFSKQKDGTITIVTETTGSFAKNVSQFKAGAIDEQIVFETIRIDRNLASVWTPYKLYLNGNFIHCGVNSFQLVRINNIWKIQYIIDTRSKQGC